MTWIIAFLILLNAGTLVFAWSLMRLNNDAAQEIAHLRRRIAFRDLQIEFLKASLQVLHWQDNPPLQDKWLGEVGRLHQEIMNIEEL